MSPREIELAFENDSTELKVKAEIDDGRVKVRAEFKTDDDSGHDGSDDDSGHTVPTTIRATTVPTTIRATTVPGTTDRELGGVDAYGEEHLRCGDREDPCLRTGAFRSRPGRIPATNHPARPRPPCADGRTTRDRSRFAIVENRIRLVSVLSGDTDKRRKISC